MFSERLRLVVRAGLARLSERMWEVTSAFLGLSTRAHSRTARWTASGRDRVVIVAPHPDDETIGAGGVTALHLRSGDSVAVVVVTDGGGSRALGLTEGEMAYRRDLEVRAAAENLGVVELHRLGLPEWRWEDAAAGEALTALLHDATIVYAPSCIDYHPEHVRVARATARALRPGQLVRVYELGVPLTPLLINRIADISDVEQAKARALASYRTQAAAVSTPQRLARYHARFYRLRAVEAFWEMADADYRRIVEAGNWTRGPSPYRGMDSRPVFDPLSVIRGLRSRLALRKIPTTLPPGKERAESRRFAPPPVALWPLLCALAVILPAGAIAALERFDGLYGQDPFGYFNYATGPLRESLLRLESPPPFFWPPVYPLLVAIFSLVLGPVPLAGQLVSLVSGGLVAFFTVLLARELWTPVTVNERSARTIPLVAGLAAALTGQLWQSSTVVMSDTTGLSLATAGVWALARYGRLGVARYLLLAAILMSSATLTRWIYGVVAVPCTVYALVVLARRPPRMALAHGAGAAACVLLLLGPTLAPAVLPLIDGASDVVPFAGNFQVYSWDPTRALGREFMTIDGLLRHDLPNLLYYGLAPARWAYFTPILAPLLLLGIGVAVRRRSSAVLFLVLGWSAAVFLFHLGAPYQNFRFTLAFLPPLAILLALGVESLRRLVGDPLWRPARAALLAGFFLMAAAGTHTTRTLIARKNENVATVQWAADRIPPGGRLLAFGITLTFRHYGPVEVLDLWDLDPKEIAGMLASDRPTFLIADTANLARQWGERAPGTNYRWLAREQKLTPLGRRESFDLFRVTRRASMAAPAYAELSSR